MPILAAVLLLGLVTTALAGCGGGAVDTSGAPTTPAAASKTISGRISYAGTALGSHKIVIAVNRQGVSGPPAYSAVLSKPGEYVIGNVADGSYSLLAFIDLGDDMGAPGSKEPSGSYDPNADGSPDLVVIKDAKSATGIDIAIKDPSP